MIRAVLFDAAGTLFHLPRGVGWHYRDVALRHGVELDEGALNRAFRSAWAGVPRPEDGSKPHEDHGRDWWRTVVFRVLDECEAGVKLDRPAYFNELWSEFEKPGVWELYPETREVLAALSRRFVLGVVSNFDSRLRRILPHLGIEEYFNTLVISSEVGADKPSPLIFREALRRLDMPPADVVYVGDDPVKDWRAAAVAGLNVVELRRPGGTLRELLRLVE